MQPVNRESEPSKYEHLISRVQALPPTVTAVAHPCDASSISGAMEAAELGIVHPILVGPSAKIRAAAEAASVALGETRIVDAPHSHAAAQAAVQLVKNGEAELLMKGSLHTDELMGAVVSRGANLRTERRISHVFVMDVPSYHKPLIITDAAINIAPTLEEKADIIRNAADVAHALGIALPKVAILSAVETVTAKIPSTIDAGALCKMADRGQIQGALLDGPLAFDNAISQEAAQTKASRRRSLAIRTSWWYRIWRRATCWPNSSPFWPAPWPQAWSSARGCR